MAVTPAGVAAIWGARDEGGTIYLYAEHRLSHPEPSENARNMRGNGEWIPGWINLSALPGSQADKHRIARMYREQGLQLQVSSAGQEAGMYQFWQLLASNKLRVFASLGRFLAEYRIADEQSAMFLCCHSLLCCAQSMRTKPVPPPVYRERKNYGERDWMA